MATTMGSLPIICFLASASAAAAAAVAAVAAAAAVVNDARSLIVSIEWEGSKPSFDVLGQCDNAAQAYALHHVCHGSPGGGSGGEYSSLPTAKVNKKMTH
jgi:hypothetical protein